MSDETATTDTGSSTDASPTPAVDPVPAAPAESALPPETEAPAPEATVPPEPEATVPPEPEATVPPEPEATVPTEPAPDVTPTEPAPDVAPPAPAPDVTPVEPGPDAVPAAPEPAPGIPAATVSAPAGPRPGGPRPGAPRPGAPRPGARPGPARSATPVARPTTAVPASDPGKFGRVDDDGAVWLVTSTGERQVGSWQAGEPVEGLAHFGRRFDDLSTEVGILERRVESGNADAKQVQDAARAISDALPTAAVVGDVERLAARLDALLERTAEAAAAAKAQKESARAEQAARKEALAVEAEAIGAESTQWKVAGDRLREILEEWKTIRGLDRKSDDALWKRYSKAREAFNRRRGGHFAELDRERAGAKTRKEELVTQAEALSTSTEFGPTAGKFRDLMTEWKAAGRAPREADDALWQRFKAAQDVFYAARNAVASERDAEFAGNAEVKRALLVEAEAIDPAADLDRAKAALRGVQDRWDAAGMVPREQVQALEGRMRAVETAVREADEARWKRTDPEAEARAAQFRERVTAFEEQAAKARAAGDTRRAEQAEAQAAQWREWADAAASAVTDL